VVETLGLHLNRADVTHEANTFTTAAHRSAKQAIGTARAAIIHWAIVAGAVRWIARGNPAWIAAAPRTELTHPVVRVPRMGVARIDRAYVAVIAKDAVVAGILGANVAIADAGLPISVAGLTSAASMVFARTIDRIIDGALVAIVARVLLAEPCNTNAV